MTESSFSRWLKKVGDTQETEIDCSACLDQISEYVDLDLATGEAAMSLPHVNHHLNQCAICFDEYQVLKELARLESTDELPEEDVLRNQLRRYPKSDP
jgi:hypothetical protein